MSKYVFGPRYTHTHTHLLSLHTRTYPSPFLFFFVTPVSLPLSHLGVWIRPCLILSFRPFLNFPTTKVWHFSLSLSRGAGNISSQLHKGKTGGPLLTRTGQFVNSQHRLLKITWVVFQMHPERGYKENTRLSETGGWTWWDMMNCDQMPLEIL